MPAYWKSVVATVVVVAVAWTFRMAMVERAQTDMLQAVEAMQQQQVAMAQRQAVEARAQSRRMAAPEEGRVLASNETCVGGSIVRLEQIDGVPTYTQVTDGSKPVMCPAP
ncbi:MULTISPECIES: hypothetical protein [Dyella]|uniref:Uncharacterized protein n=2 Tax=Dyella TaxID=231454 RepID=A0A4R0Z0B5_9GAMM|nr:MULTISPECIES: hypothetical protein [Dyella]TBR39348.1 hypothetical protein EYV96_03745 [Dyella terrae]TCI13064.1 hypothetical protein EZM97_07120 [Dyella soli]